VPDFRADDRSALQIDDVFGPFDHVAGTRLRSADKGIGIVRMVPLAVRGPAVCAGQVKAGHLSRIADVHAGIGREPADIFPLAFLAVAAAQGR
jgi:hypothetical protein